MSQNLSSAAVVIGTLRVKRPPCQLNCLRLYSNQIYGKDFANEINSSPHLVLAAHSKAVVLLLSIHCFVVAFSVLQLVYNLGFLVCFSCVSLGLANILILKGDGCFASKMWLAYLFVLFCLGLITTESISIWPIKLMAEALLWVHSLFIAAPIVCSPLFLSLFCYAVLSVLSSFAILLLRKRAVCAI